MTFPVGRDGPPVDDLAAVLISVTPLIAMNQNFIAGLIRVDLVEEVVRVSPDSARTGKTRVVFEVGSIP